jgi:hypothetical protein
LPLAPESDYSIAVDFSTLPDDPKEICGATVDRALFFSWTADHSGEAFLLYEDSGAGDITDEILIAMSDDLMCSSWLKCDYLAMVPMGHGEFKLDVEEGTQYRIVLATPIGSDPGRGILTVMSD